MGKATALGAAALAGAALLTLAPAPLWAAASATCVCRSEDGKSFTESTVRFSRWACDAKLGYTSKAKGKARPPEQTCNKEEIYQYWVWACMERGCTYPYSQSTETRNKALESIEPLRGKRTP